MNQPAIRSNELKIGFGDLRQIEQAYPGILTNLRNLIVEARVTCPHCRSENSATVIRGFIGRTLALAGATPRVKLVPPSKSKQSHYCRSCERFFQTSKLEA